MGVVYEALEETLGRTVALKLILDTHLAEPEVRRRFKIEAEAAAKLEHANIVPVYGFGERDGQPFLSMQLVKGDTLKEKIRRGELCLAQEGTKAKYVALFMLKVARAVAHAHERNVLHRDLKPANILVDSKGEPHLTDFGLAKILQATAEAQCAATQTGGVLGTPSYMAPEQAKGGISSKPADVYSLGAILYEMLTGQPPFKGATSLSTIKLVTEENPKKPRDVSKGIPQDLETICLKCLEKLPGSRYASAEALAEDLERWLQNKPILGQRVGRTVRLTSWCRRNPAGATLILTLCVAFSCSLALMRAMQRQELASRNLQDLFQDGYVKYIQLVAADPGKDHVLFTNGYLAAIGQRSVPLNSIPLTFGMEITDNPLAQATTVAPVLQLIEAKMEQKLRQPVAFNLVLQKHRPDVAALLVSNVVQFQRMGPVAYVRAKEACPALQLVVQEVGSRDGVIFAREDVVRERNITNLGGIKGLRVAFAHTNSIVSFEAKRQLALAGISAKDLSRYSHLDPVRVLLANGPEGQTLDDLADRQFAHAVVIEAVVTNAFDVGEARWSDFEKRRERGAKIVPLLRFQVPPRVYVAGPDVPGATIEAFRKSLLEFKAPAEISALRKLFNQHTAGFSPVTDKDLDYIHVALTNEIDSFEAGQPAAGP